KQYSVPFIINDNVEVAIKCNADGIHVGQSDMSANDIRKLVGDKMIIGVSANSVAQAKEASRNGADYLGVGAVFSTTTKLDANAIPHSVVHAICDSVDIPIVAIGGINKENILELSGTGIDGVALVSAIFASSDIENECKSLRYLSEKMVKS
ncbi:MAG: thiamine phosphate synthase, partial [Suipraeoptans sp.]